MIRAASRWIARQRLLRTFTETDGSSSNSKVSTHPKTKEEIEKEAKMRAEIREAMEAWAKSQGTVVPKMVAATFIAVTVPSMVMGFVLVMTPYEDPMFLRYLKNSYLMIFAQNVFFVGIHQQTFGLGHLEQFKMSDRPLRVKAEKQDHRMLKYLPMLIMISFPNMFAPSNLIAPLIIFGAYSLREQTTPRRDSHREEVQ